MVLEPAASWFDSKVAGGVKISLLFQAPSLDLALRDSLHVALGGFGPRPV